MATPSTAAGRWWEGVPASGRWIWKDDATNPCLEFISNNPNSDKQDRRKRAKASDVKGRGERTSAGIPKAGMLAGGKATVTRFHTSSQDIREQQEDRIVTLGDIKNASLEIMSEDHNIPVHFEILYRKERLDDFLVHILNYFQCFFNKVTMENKKHMMYIEPSQGEKLEYAYVCDQLRHAQKLLGRAYSLLLLGLEVEEQHHMECGRLKVSRTHTDRSMFETFYHFCTLFVWITFRRKDFETIKQEVGRLLRSDTFNPALRVNSTTTENGGAENTKTTVREETEKEQKGSGETKKFIKMEIKQRCQKRPTISSVMTQRSPAIVAILPLPREEAHWLFRRPHEKTDRSSFYALTNAEAKGYTDDSFWHEVLDVSNLRVGILGEPFRQFDSLTLTPLGAENEDDDDGDEGGTEGTRRVSDNEDDEGETNKQPGHGLSRQATAISRATTEAAFTDDES